MIKNQSSIRAVSRSLSCNKTYVSDASVEVRRFGGHGPAPYGMTVRLVCQEFVALG